MTTLIIQIEEGASALLLGNNPRIAPAETQLADFPQGFRSMVVHKLHKIVYYIDSDCVNITTIWDCRRNPATLRKIASEKRD